ncbi:MAG: hypothetical protein HY727_19300 [Candidatus Rokubacteria bacterium]|nr:hypothetical protein [Candidatus Rokubacteria bacterium]
MKTWLGPLLVVLGIVLASIGLYNWGALMAAPLEGQQAHLAAAMFPLVIGLWLLIAGAYALTH